MIRNEPNEPHDSGFAERIPDTRRMKIVLLCASVSPWRALNYRLPISERARSNSST